MEYDQKQFDDLSERAWTASGSDVMEWINGSPPARSTYRTALAGAVRTMDGPNEVADEQVLGAYDVAVTVWPPELEFAHQLTKKTEGKED